MSAGWSGERAPNEITIHGFTGLGEPVLLTVGDVEFTHSALPGLLRKTQLKDYWMDAKVTVRDAALATTTTIQLIEPYREDLVAFMRQAAEVSPSGQPSAIETENGELALRATVGPSGDAGIKLEVVQMLPSKEARTVEFWVSAEDLRAAASGLAALFRVGSADVSRLST